MTGPSEDLPSRQFWKKSSWPIPQPEMTPRPVTTTRSASDFAYNVVEVEEEEVVGVAALFICAIGVNADDPRKDDDINRRDTWNFILLL